MHIIHSHSCIDLILHELHQEVDKRAYPTGRWVMMAEVRANAVSFSSAADDNSDNDNNGGGSDDDAAHVDDDASASTNRVRMPMDLIKPRLLRHYSNGHKIQLRSIPSHLMKERSRSGTDGGRRYSRKYILAKDFGITPCTLRLHGVGVTSGIEHLKFFFEDYDLSVDGMSLERLKEPDPQTPRTKSSSRFTHDRSAGGEIKFSWLVRFQSPAEAQRAFFTLDNAELNGHNVQMFRYT